MKKKSTVELPTTLESRSKRQLIAGIAAMAGAVVTNNILTPQAIAAAKGFQQAKQLPHVNGERLGKVVEGPMLTLLEWVAETIIPLTDTPGARAVDCHGFINHQLFHCYSKKYWQRTISLLEVIEKRALAQFAQSFYTLQQGLREQLLLEIERSELRDDFKWLKALVCFGYYTSELGANLELNYLAVPGKYRSIKINADTKAWSSLAYY